LVEAYELLKAIYLERGYRLRDIPRLILEKNLFGLDIDNRAAQLASFALLMKARADDRRLFDNPPQLNIYAMQESAQLDLDRLSNALASEGVSKSQLALLLETFTQAKTYGSLTQIEPVLANQLPTLLTQLTQASQSQDLFVRQAAQDCLPLVLQAILLAKTYDAVIANPPYMGGKYMQPALKDYAKTFYPDTKSDLFAMFIERCNIYAKPSSELAFVTPYVWMFISSYEKIRTKLVTESTIKSLIQLEYNAFEPACVPVCTFVVGKQYISRFVGTYIRLSDFKGHENQAPKTLEAIKAERQRLGFPV
jgi:type II restriction/modification system DNA methylase subunit YeeA